MAYDEGLAERIRDVLGEVPVWDEKKMFGGLGFMIGGTWSAGSAVTASWPAWVRTPTRKP